MPDFPPNTILDSILVKLNQTDLQQKNPRLYQVIKDLDGGAKTTDSNLVALSKIVDNLITVVNNLNPSVINQLITLSEGDSDGGEALIVPGPKGDPGAAGAAGPAGVTSIVTIVEDAAEPEIFPIPGPVGPTGAAGATGPQGLQGTPIYIEPELPEEPLVIPGPTGPLATWVDFTQDLGSGETSGNFQITNLSGLTQGSDVAIVQTAQTIVSKGNARDEFEMDNIQLTGYVLNSTTIQVYWNCQNPVSGIYAFAFAVTPAVIPLSYLPGELDYVEFTATVSITATTEGTAQTIVTGNTITYDGNTAIIIEFLAPNARPDNTVANRTLTFCLFQDGLSIGQFQDATPAGGSDNKPIEFKRRLTPSAGSHTYSIRAFVSAGTGAAGAGTGGAGNIMPGFIRTTVVQNSFSALQPGNWVKIDEKTPNGTNKVTFSNLGNFTHLKVVFTARSDGAGSGILINMQFNGDTGANYSREFSDYTGTTATANGNFGATAAQIAAATGASSPANYFGAGEILIFDYRNTLAFKEAVSLNIWRTASSVAGQSGRSQGYDWASLAAIFQIDYTLATGNYVNGSKFSLYGAF